MKFLIFLAGCWSLSFMPVLSSAQIHIGAQLSALKNTKEDVAITGGGFHGLVFLGQQVAIGGNVRIWPKKFEEETQGSITARSGNFVGDVAGMLEVYFGEKDIRPYIGTDVGAYFTNTIFEVKDGNNVLLNESDRKVFFGIAPKAGLGFDVTSIVGFLLQIQYNALFGSASEFQSNGLRSKPVDKFWCFDIGAYLRLKPAGKK